MMTGRTRVFFATDIHGSNVCFRKFLNAGKHYGADVLIIGGDVTGKRLVPIVRQPHGTHHARFAGEDVVMNSESEVVVFEQRLGDQGVYGFRCDRERESELAGSEPAREALFEALIKERMTQWVELADERMSGQNRRVFFNAGNDDPFCIDDIIHQSRVMCRPEGKVVEVDEDLTMISTGFANLTPWHCYRDISEAELQTKIDTMARDVRDFSRCIFNLHCPPYDTVLDRAQKLDEDLRPQVTGFGVEECSVGSTAVREAIAEYQPSVGLHGHIHESRGVAHIGRSVCLNPGSEYQEGILRGLLLDFNKGEVKNHSFTSG